MSVDVIREIVLGERSNVLLRSQDGASQTSTLKGSGVQMIQNKLLLLLVDLRHFPQDDITFSLYGALVELGVEEDVRKNIESLANVLLENLGKVDSLLTGCVSVPKVEVENEIGELLPVSC